VLYIVIDTILTCQVRARTYLLIATL